MRTPRPLIFILFVTAVLVASSCSGAGRGANNGGVDGGGSDAGSADASGFADGGGSGGSDAMFNPDTAAPDGSSMSDAGFDADASIPPQDPDPTCEGGGSDGQLPEGTIAGAVTTPHPTLNNITVEWAIEGDEDLDGAVRVRYREEGAPYWNRGMALRRIPAGETEGLPWGNRHSGSVFDLEPGTRYEIELWLVDPDGGCRFETVTVETRPLPTPMAGAPVKAVTPDTLEDTLSAAQPGDIIDLGPGTYDGFNVEVDGEPGKEIVIRSTQGAVIDGTVDASNREYVQIVGLTANRIRFDNSRRISIMGNTVNVEVRFEGIGAYDRAEDAYIADNVVTGPTIWREAALGVDGDNLGECILVTGPGHVVAHNRITGCRDNISFLEGGDRDQYSIDVFGNDIYEAADDGIEADFCEHNCRIMRNRMTNVFIAMSSQPSLGGPTYFIRNVVYSNIYRAAFKLHRRSIGDVILHNTVVKMGDAFAVTAGVPHTRTFSRNNLFIGGEGGTFAGYNNGDGRIVYLPDSVDGDYDYDGLGSAVGNYGGRIGDTSFDDFMELRSATTYANAVQVGLDVFATSVVIPSQPFSDYTPVDFTLAAGAAAVDKALAIANVNDGHRGEAADLGAYELGDELPTYGPR